MTPRLARAMRGAALVLAASALGAAGARASDGVLEIHQACADGAGCFPGDTPGLPVQITSAAGASSFVLTSDLVVPNADTRAIQASGTLRGLVIDLNGFAILGPVTCAGQPATCNASGTGSGIQATGPTLVGVTVRNGTVRGMGSTGIALGDGCAVHDVSVVGNAGSGVSGGTGCRVERTSAVRNGGSGVAVTTHSVVRHVVARGNASVGVFASGSSVVQESVAVQNGLDGIQVGDEAVVSLATANGNGRDGVSAGDGCVLRGAVAFENDDDGVACQSGCSVQTAVARDNGDAGLSFLDLLSTYTTSSMTNNGGAAVTLGVARGGNHCVGPGVAAPPDCP